MFDVSETDQILLATKVLECFPFEFRKHVAKYITTHKLFKSKSRYGWLTRNGVFLGCNYGGHSILSNILGETCTSQLEKMGWLHISFNGNKTIISGVCEPNKPQMNYIMINFTDFEFDIPNNGVRIIVDDIMVSKFSDNRKSKIRNITLKNKFPVLEETG